MKETRMNEPDFKTACEWWPDLTNVWTPIGWKDHLFRFNVFWSGMILAQPDLNRRTWDNADGAPHYSGQGMQLTFIPAGAAANVTGGGFVSFFRQDDGGMRQQWDAAKAPVLATEWTREGLTLRQQVFAHLAGGRECRTGAEPLFAWVRLSIHDICDALPVASEYGFQIWLQAPHLLTTMSLRSNILFHRALARYPRALESETAPVRAGGFERRYDPRRGWRLLEPDGRVRLGIAPRQDCAVYFRDYAGLCRHCGKPHEPPSGCWKAYEMGDEYRLYVKLNAARGAHADLLLPMTPMDRGVFDRELALGYDRALAESNAFWSQKPRGAARISVPEHFLPEACRRGLEFAQVLTEKNPATGKHCIVLGSLAYTDLWATPGAMVLAMILDTLGYHDAAGKYLDIFRSEQGTGTPPGKAFAKHPGFFSTPALYRSGYDWLSENGAILYAICTHALLTGDKAFIDRFAGAIVKSCEWIRDARGLRGHGGAKGVLPAGKATDTQTEIQAVWNDGWNYKGLATAARLLRRIGHPRADEFAREAADFRAAFRRAFRAKAGRMPKWTDRRGRRLPLIPLALSGKDEAAETRHAFYLDTGPLCLVFFELLDAGDPLMRAALEWFREGPRHGSSRPGDARRQITMLDHEISSCEPGYSWNIFHSWQAGDRLRFLEGMYSVFAGAMSRQTMVPCETRGGITGLAFSLGAYLLRLCVVDDQVKHGELHLLRLMPLAWLQPGKSTAFDRIPTEFGPVTIRTKMPKTGGALEVEFLPCFRRGWEPERIVLHAPPVTGLKSLKLNGRAIRGFKPQTAPGAANRCQAFEIPLD